MRVFDAMTCDDVCVRRVHTKDDEHVVDVHVAHGAVCLLLGAGHGAAHLRNVRVVPGVVVDQNRTVSEGSIKRVRTRQ